MGNNDHEYKCTQYILQDIMTNNILNNENTRILNIMFLSKSIIV